GEHWRPPPAHGHDHAPRRRDVRPARSRDGPDRRHRGGRARASQDDHRRRGPEEVHFVVMPTDFLAIPDFSRTELDRLFELAERMRAGKYDRQPLAGKTLAMIFMKSSTRTRVSF